MEQMRALPLAGQRPRAEKRRRTGRRARPRRVHRAGRPHALEPCHRRRHRARRRLHAKEFEPCSLADVERHHILATLTATGWNKSRTATILGIERSTLDRKIRRYEITRRY